MDKREFVQDTAQKLLLQAFSTVPGDRTEQAIKAITRAADMLAHELEVSGNGWHTGKVQVTCGRCGGQGVITGGGFRSCPGCNGSGKVTLPAPVRRP